MAQTVNILFVYLLVFQGTVDCLQCYICSTMVNGNSCRHLGSGAYTQLCLGGACLTRHNFDGSVQRDCGIGTFGNTCQNIAGAQVCYCTSDRCNGDKGSYNTGVQVHQTLNRCIAIMLLWIFVYILIQ